MSSTPSRNRGSDVNYVVVFGVVAAIAWGFWAVFADLATRTLAPEVAMVCSYSVGILVALGYILSRNDPVSIARSGVGFALVAGVFSGAGAVSYYHALESGAASIATTLTALYFVVAAVLGVLVLDDSLELTDAAGIACAVVAVVLIAR